MQQDFRSESTVSLEDNPERLHEENNVTARYDERGLPATPNQRVRGVLIWGNFWFRKTRSNTAESVKPRWGAPWVGQRPKTLGQCSICRLGESRSGLI